MLLRHNVEQLVDCMVVELPDIKPRCPSPVIYLYKRYILPYSIFSNFLIYFQVVEIWRWLLTLLKTTKHENISIHLEKSIVTRDVLTNELNNGIEKNDLTF